VLKAIPRSSKKVASFYLLTAAPSSPFWWLIIRGPTTWLFAFLMWCPAAAAVITQLTFRDRLGDHDPSGVLWRIAQNIR
jgi:predicted membrane channel-forming protein YqfA (hemolysin III family)